MDRISGVVGEGCIVAVDFDGVLCKDMFPEIGEEHREAVELVKQLKSAGAKVILWTCRRDDRLTDALKWCTARGLWWDEVNSNTKENIEKYGGDTRKVFAHLYLEDKAISFPMPFQDQFKQKLLAILKEKRRKQ